MDAADKTRLLAYFGQHLVACQRLQLLSGRERERQSVGKRGSLGEVQFAFKPPAGMSEGRAGEAGKPGKGHSMGQLLKLLKRPRRMLQNVAIWRVACGT